MRVVAALRLSLAAVALHAQSAGAAAVNPEIDMAGFLASAADAAGLRETRRVDEDAFLRMMREPGTVVLDARSRAMYDRRHVAGAVSLPFTEFTAESLARAIPDRDARVLIYCNNNFAGDPDAFPLKAAAASLNLSTFVALVAYGYRNVIELAPHVEVTRTAIPLVPAPIAR
jgi:phage shock protein E